MTEDYPGKSKRLFVLVTAGALLILTVLVAAWLLSRAPDTAVVVCVNRSALRQQVRAALADGAAPVGKPEGGEVTR
jgi:hypothetical protein